MTNKVDISQTDSLELANSNTPLSGGGIFTGSIFNVRGYTNITGFVFSNVASDATGLIVQQAMDTADFASGFLTRSTQAYTAGDTNFNAFVVEIVAPFVRIIYQNGAGAQTTFRIWASAKTLRGA